jgi:hypothetical protein
MYRQMEQGVVRAHIGVLQEVSAEKAAIKLVKEAERAIEKARLAEEALADKQARAAERAAIRAQERANKKAETDADKAFKKGQREAKAAARNIIKGAELLLKEQRRQERTEKAIKRDEETAAKKLIRDAAAAAREIAKAKRLTEREEKALAKEIERTARDARILSEREQREKARDNQRAERESLKEREQRERLRARFTGRAERLSESEQKRFDKFVASVPERIQRTKRSMERTKQTIELMKTLGESPDIVRGEKFFRRRYQAEEALDKKIERLQALRQPSRIFRKKTGGVARLQKQGVMLSFIDFLPDVIETPANRSAFAASPLHKIEADRAFMLVDYAVRSFVPLAFLALGHKAVAENIKRLYLIKDAKSAQEAIRKLFEGTDTQPAILEPVADDRGAEEQRNGEQTKAALPFDAMAAAHRCADFAVEFAAKKTNNADLAYEIGHMASYALTCALAAGVDRDYIQSIVNSLFREARRSQVR